jgi:hypothetical protein
MGESGSGLCPVVVFGVGGDECSGSDISVIFIFYK